MLTEEERAYLWLCTAEEFDYREKVTLLRAAQPAEIFLHAEERAEEILHRPIVTPLSMREERADALVKALEQADAFVVTLFSDDYPESLKHITAPPLILFGSGNRELLTKRKFCIVGSRVIPPWAEKTGKRIAKELASQFVLVTGLAEGGDLAVIDGALPSGNLISVLPCGIDCCYPAAHITVKQKIREKGLLLTELAPGDTTRKYTFHARNRILAGLSEGVLVLAAGKRSGTLITASAALDYGRDVFAFPHNVGTAAGEGCNDLIKKGAALVTCSQDIFGWYGMQCAEREELPLTEEEGRVLAILREEGEMHLTAIAERAGMKPFEASAVLSALEIKGAAVKSGGNKYSILS